MPNISRWDEFIKLGGAVKSTQTLVCHFLAEEKHNSTTHIFKFSKCQEKLQFIRICSHTWENFHSSHHSTTIIKYNFYHWGGAKKSMTSFPKILKDTSSLGVGILSQLKNRWWYFYHPGYKCQSSWCCDNRTSLCLDESKSCQ